MKKLSKICCGRPDADAEQPRLVSRSVVRSRLSRPNVDVLRVRKVDNAFSVPNARFSPNGNLHSIVINLGKEDEQKMTLIIDGETFYEADTNEKFAGNAELNIDGLVVDFEWNLTNKFSNFSFYVRDSGGGSGGGGGGSSSNDGGDAGEPKQGEDHVHVYLLQILEL